MNLLIHPKPLKISYIIHIVSYFHIIITLRTRLYLKQRIHHLKIKYLVITL